MIVYFTSLIRLLRKEIFRVQIIRSVFCINEKDILTTVTKIGNHALQGSTLHLSELSIRGYFA